MTIKNTTFLKQIAEIPENTVVTSSWLKTKGISNGLQHYYANNGWLKPVGQGAFIKFNSKNLSIDGALYALQSQLHLPVHIGGQFALVLQKVAHYARSKNNWTLFSTKKILLPSWFKKYKFNDAWKIYKTSFLPDNTGIVKFKSSNISIQVSSPERAALELLYQIPKDISLIEAAEIFELLTDLRARVLQELLEQCKSVKVKRLFLYFAERTWHPWLKYVNVKKINLGKGVREITKNGKYNKKFNLVIGGLDENK
jgi:hypothetical protein